MSKIKVRGKALRECLQNSLLRKLIDAEPLLEYALMIRCLHLDDNKFKFEMQTDPQREGLAPDEISRSLLGLDALPIKTVAMESPCLCNWMVTIEFGANPKSASLYPPSSSLRDE